MKVRIDGKENSAVGGTARERLERCTGSGDRGGDGLESCSGGESTAWRLTGMGRKGEWAEFQLSRFWCLGSAVRGDRGYRIWYLLKRRLLRRV